MGEPMTPGDKEAYIKEYAGLVWNIGQILEDRRSGDYVGANDGAIWEYLYDTLDSVYDQVGPIIDRIEDAIFGEPEPRADSWDPGTRTLS